MFTYKLDVTVDGRVGRVSKIDYNHLTVSDLGRDVYGVLGFGLETNTAQFVRQVAYFFVKERDIACVLRGVA